MTSVLVGEAISVVYAMFLALALGSAEFNAWRSALNDNFSLVHGARC
jgi:hypothetical protein